MINKFHLQKWMLGNIKVNGLRHDILEYFHKRNFILIDIDFKILNQQINNFQYIESKIAKIIL